MSGFITKIDYSDNRQIRQSMRTSTDLSGATVHGVTFSALTSGPDPNNSGTTSTLSPVYFSFSGNTGETVYSFANTILDLGIPNLGVVTDTTSGGTFYTMAFTASSTTVIDGNTAALAYTGVTYNLLVYTTVSGAGPIFTGSGYTYNTELLSANTLDFTGRTIWADVQGILRTEKLIVSNAPTLGYVLTCSNIEGMVEWQPSSGATSGTTYWSAGTGTNAITLKYSNGSSNGILSVNEGENSIAFGDNSHAEGKNTSAYGKASHSEGDSTYAVGGNAHAEGHYTTAAGQNSHTEGFSSYTYGASAHAEGTETIAYGQYSHAEGSATTANGYYAHAEGVMTIAIGSASHAEGGATTASGNASHAEGVNTTAIGGSSHAEGSSTIASGPQAHAEGSLTIASGDHSHAEGENSTASGVISHAEGDWTTASGVNSHAEGYTTKAIGDYSHAGGYLTTASGVTSFVHSSNSVAGGARSAVLGGQNITGTSADTVYVPDLVIDGLTSTDPIATDADGRIVAGVSDARLKQNVIQLSDALNKILNVRGVSFEYTPESNMGGGTRYGFIAQEVQNIIPDIVRIRAKSDDMLSLNYNEIVPLLVEAIKELVSGGTQVFDTETILAEDNNIELNYNGTHNTAIGGGIVVTKGVNDTTNSSFTTDENGNFLISPAIIPNKIILPQSTPTSTNDSSGSIGELRWDDNYMYVKTNDNQWKRTKLEIF